MFRRSTDKDLYAILQVDPRAEPEVIEAAYRRLSRKHHPDVSAESDAGRRMRELNEAFEVLSDPARRRAYDLHRSFGSRSAPSRLPMASQDWLRPVLSYVGLAILVVLSLRVLPLLLRPPILAALAVAGLVYLFLRHFRRH